MQGLFRQHFLVRQQSIIAHYQFEAIHPFTDGNGRTGRLLNILFLVEQELLTLLILYLSRYIIEHKNDITTSNDFQSYL
jgi:Fic family protein